MKFPRVTILAKFLLKGTVLAGLVLVMPLAHAGSIAFSISFTGNDIAIVNSGTQAAYQISEWTLDAANQWRKVQILEGNEAYLAPGKTLKGRRLMPAAPAGLGRIDPLLLLLHDQAGSLSAQLTWRQAPQRQSPPLPTQRSGRQLNIANTTEPTITATYGIVVPYDGIGSLAQPLTTAAQSPPANPQPHIWSAGKSMLLDTGAAQAGAWLVHETTSGDLRVQIVPDIVVRGQEQIPGWLVWARQHLMKLATVLAGLGALTMAFGLILAARRRQSSR